MNDDDPKKMSMKQIHDIEQATTAIREHFVPVVVSFFDSLVSGGLTRQEALFLTNTYLRKLLYGANPDASN